MESSVPRHRYVLFETNFGQCALAWSSAGVSALLLPDKNARETVKRLSQRFPDDVAQAAPPAAIKRTIAKIQRHLQGNLCELDEIEIDYEGVPPFFRKVYEAARSVPAGRTMSYGQLAKEAGSPAAARAVGQALARNPVAIIVPCHRILGTTGAAVGFSAYGGCNLKQKLLLLEGVQMGSSKPKKAGAASRRERKHLPDATAGLRFAPGTPSRLDFDPELAVKTLGSADRVLAKLMAKVGPFRLELDEMLSPFEALAESIVYQQLTGKAAATIYGRVKDLYGGRLPAPQKIIETPDQSLRAVGLSGAKTAALKDLAQKQHEGLIPTLPQMQRMTDAEIVSSLVTIRGIGRWTAEMLLIFRLGRPDVLPVHDYGVRKGFAATYGERDELPTPGELEKFGERWRPFRSVAAWYMWRALELPENKRQR